MRDIPQNLLDLVSDTMRATYPPEPRNKGIAMWLVRSLTNVVENCPVEFCLSVLQTLKESLCMWLADECGAWTEEHFTYDVKLFFSFTFCFVLTFSFLLDYPTVSACSDPYSGLA